MEHLPGIVRTLLALCVWLLALTAFFVPVERLFAARPSGIFRPEIFSDLGYFFLSGLIPAAALSLPVMALAWSSHRLLPVWWVAHVAALPLWARIAASMVVAEIGLYWGHRWCHESPLLWRFHAIHHSATHIDWLVNSRAHPVDFVFTRLCGLVPMYAVGLASPLGGASSFLPIAVLVPSVAWGFFIHANVRWRFGPLEWVVSTPAFHHWHHTNDGPAVINRNYAPTLPWVDRLFGTYYLPRGRLPEVYGTDTAVSPGLAGQLIEPFALRPSDPVPANGT